MSWQPIETAPKDGTRFLAWTVTPIYDEDARTTISDEAAVVAYWLWSDFIEYPGPPKFVQGQRFTHWQPLPEPPAEQSALNREGGK